MSPNPPLNKRKNKNFVIKNKHFLKQFALKSHEIFGEGIIIINLLLLKTDIIDARDIPDYDTEEDRDITIHQPISYIPQNNFWFKMLNLKIKKKYKVNIQEEDRENKKVLIVFVKDASIEHFSIYSLKL